MVLVEDGLSPYIDFLFAEPILPRTPTATRDRSLHRALGGCPRQSPPALSSLTACLCTFLGHARGPRPPSSEARRISAASSSPSPALLDLAHFRASTCSRWRSWELLRCRLLADPPSTPQPADALAGGERIPPHLVRAAASGRSLEAGPALLDLHVEQVRHLSRAARRARTATPSPAPSGRWQQSDRL